MGETQQELYGLRAVASIVGQSYHTICRDVRRGRLKVVLKTGQSRPYYVTQDELRRYLAEEYGRA